MNSKTFSLVLTLAAALPVASADTADDVRARIAQVATELPVRRKHRGRIIRE